MEFTGIKMGEELNNSIYNLTAGNYPGLLGVETATAYWGMSTFNPEIPIFLINDNTQDNDGYFSNWALSYLFVPNVNTKNIVNLSECLSVTDREQTVCDMVRYNRHEFHLFETVLSAYDDGDVDVDRLEKMADDYGLLDRLHQIYQEALEVEDEG